MREGLSRVLRRPRTVDAVIALVAAVSGVVDTVVDEHNGVLSGYPVWAVTVSVAVAGLLVVRRRWPLAVTAVVLAAHVLAFTPMPLAVAMYTVGASTRSVRRLAAVGLAATVLHAFAVQHSLAIDARTWAYTLAFAVGPLLWGYAVGIRQDLAASWEQHALVSAREAEVRARQARREEQARIAREMHDTLAHRVGNMTVTAAAWELTNGQASAEAGLIRREGRQALAELRQILGVLAGPGQECAPLRPSPGVRDIADLVADTRQAGLNPVSLAVAGDPGPVPEAVQRAVYRVVQEGLTNAVKHAPGATTAVTVECRAREVVARVANGSATCPPLPDLVGAGHGLPGLAERLRLLGGTVSAQRTDEGGFDLMARIPAAPAEDPRSDGEVLR